jgi:Glucoamylase and related glycosyl hydrolases
MRHADLRTKKSIADFEFRIANLRTYTAKTIRNPKSKIRNVFFFVICMTAVYALPSAFAQPTLQLAPGGPGIDAHWPDAAKDGFGTATSLRSKLWFTLTNGVMSEVYYPTLDTPNTQSLRFIFCTDQTCIDEANDMKHALRVLDSRSLTFQQINTTQQISITKTYTTDVDRATVLIDVNIQSSNAANTSVYLYYDPSLKNSGMHDTAWNDRDSLLASDADISSALLSSSGFEEVSNGFAGVDRPGKWRHYDRAENGNVVQVAKLRPANRFTVALAFGSSPAGALDTARRSLSKGFALCRSQYDRGWHAYVSSLLQVRTKHTAQLKMAAMVLKALEDKTYRGAFIASPSIPWGGGPNANEPSVSGYHAVWARDLYHIATALVAIGDQAAANRALNYLFKIQQRPDGSFPQNSRVDGKPIGGGLQLDQVALPIVLALQLRRTDAQVWVKNVKPAADFIVAHGPVTNQDRWEEKSGYSPATIAAEIAGLVCAAEIARRNRDNASAVRYLKTADGWKSALTTWTVTSNGPQGDRKYFLRLTEKGNPNDGDVMDINSGGGKFDQRSIVDPGFLELVRLGIKPANDSLIVNSLEFIDSLIGRDTPFGPAWYRYNNDAYGERADGTSYDGKSGIGRLWTLLTGERGEYELASGRNDKAQQMLDAMAGFANAGRMIPEQVWDRSDGSAAKFSIGSGTGSATPLAWSMAQFIRLAVNIQSGRNLETPEIVAARYARTFDSRNH